MQVGCRGPGAAQGGHIEADERTAEARARAGRDRADVCKDIERAVGEGCTAVTGCAILRAEDLLTGSSDDTQRAAGAAVRADAVGDERFHIRGQRIEIGAYSRLGIAERLAARAGVELRIRHQSGATGQGADLAFKVLHFIKVAAPMQHALIGMAFERDGVAQTFTQIGQIPNAAIMPGVVVADGATDVLLQC